MKKERTGENMNTKKLNTLASTIVNYSLTLQENDKVIVNFTKEATPLVEELIKEAQKVGAIMSLNLYDPRLNARLAEKNTDARLEHLKNIKQFEVDNYDAFISICSSINDYESKNVPVEMKRKLGAMTQDLDDIRINERRWTLLNYPTDLDAYKAHMTTAEFNEFALDVMTVDYRQMSKDIAPLKKLMEKTDKVRIVSPGTDITFSIKDMPAIPCTGEKNIPDGELYSAPIKDSVNGVITYNTPSPYQGRVYNHVSLTFENGKIIKATCDEDDKALNEIFDTDEGARYVGEFSLGFNPKILYPMGDILYDEKILGSLHFTPGRCYADCDNGNISSIHWDMVLIQREEFGGGEIYFDDVLIRKNGKFVLEELKVLNYEN